MKNTYAKVLEEVENGWSRTLNVNLVRRYAKQIGEPLTKDTEEQIKSKSFGREPSIYRYELVEILEKNLETKKKKS